MEDICKNIKFNVIFLFKYYLVGNDSFDFQCGILCLEKLGLFIELIFFSDNISGEIFYLIFF